MENFLFKYMDNLPSVPEHFIVRTFEKFNDMPKDITLSSEGPPGSVYHRHFVDKDFENWLRENIVNDAVHYTVTINYNTLNVYPMEFYPHLDGSRDYTLIYCIDPGGDNVLTTFYQELDFPVERDRSIMNWGTNLTKLTEVRIEPRKWCMLNASVIHGVANMVRPRNSLQIGLMKPNKFLL